MVTQILFGEKYKVLETKEDSDWCRIQLVDDGYVGWVDGLPLESDSTEGKDQYPIVVPILHHNGKWIPMGGISDVLSKPEGLLPTARSMLGAPYLWGGKTVLGIDCSGFVQVVHKANGIQLPRDASQQFEEGEEVPFAEHKAGDLAFFNNKEGRITHVGIVIDQNRIIHASQWVRIDELRNDGIYRKNEVKTHTLTGIKRLP